MSVDEYIALRNMAGCLPDLGNYNLNAAEMNPAIFERFVSAIEKAMLPRIIWEPFAGTSHPESFPNSYAQDSAERNGIELISNGLVPRDSRIQVRDSTKEGPGKKIGGMLFHPPYPGYVPMSVHSSDLSKGECWNWAWYIEGLKRTIRLARDSMLQGGLVCAVGRDYRLKGDRMRLDHLYVSLFEREGFVLVDVWVSNPDVVQIYKWRTQE